MSEIQFFKVTSLPETLEANSVYAVKTNTNPNKFVFVVTDMEGNVYNVDHSSQEDDYQQYHNNSRGDARYYTKAQVDTSLGDKIPKTISNGNSAHTIRYSGSWAWSEDGAVTGAIQIRLVGLYAYTLSGGFNITLTQNNIDDGTYADYDFYIAGNWRASDHAWHNAEARCDTTGATLNVRFAHNTTDVFILIGDTNTPLKYPRVFIKEVFTNAIVGYTPDFVVSRVTAYPTTVNYVVLPTRYQPILESTVNIKTINGVSVLGAGDMVVGGNANYIPFITNPFVSTLYFPTTDGISQYPAGVPTNYIYYYPFVLTHDQNITRMAFKVDTTVAGSLAEVGIYSSSISSVPNQKIVSSASISCATTGIKAAAVSSTTLVAGNLYYIAIQCNNNAVRFTASNAINNMLGVSSNAFNKLSAFIQSGSTLPATAAPSAVDNTSPIMIAIGA